MEDSWVKSSDVVQFDYSPTRTSPAIRRLDFHLVSGLKRCFSLQQIMGGSLSTQIRILLGD